MADVEFVTPGPAVTAATPHSRVTFAHPSAAKADAVLLRAHEHGPDMSAVQGEEMTHTGSFESQCDQLAGIARIRHSATAQGMAEVLNAAWGEPSRPMRITPPEAWSALPR